MPPTPQSNVERYLSVIAGYGGEIPSEPSSRVEYYLDKIVKNGGIGGKLKPKVVASLPATGESGVLYLVSADGSGKNLYNEYVWIEEETRFELLGQTKVDIDLSDYVQNTRKVGGKPLSADVGISVTGTAPIKVTDNGTVSSVAYNISHEDSGVTAGNKGDVTNQTPGFGGTFKVLSVAVDAKGHVTALNDHTTRIPDAEATQSAKGLMSPTDKEKLDTLIDSTLSNSGKAADAKATGDNLSALWNLLSRMEIYCTASGNPATFSDADAANIKALSVTLTPTQSGSGDPSPTNIRPISSVSSVSVTRTGQNGANSQTVTVQLTDGSNPLTVYGGTLNVTTGELAVTHQHFLTSNMDFWGDSVSVNNHWRFYTRAFDICREKSADVWCDKSVYAWPYASDQNAVYFLIGEGGSRGSFFVRKDLLSDGTVASGSAYLRANAIEVVAPLTVPVTYQLTPQQLATLHGYNAVSTDAASVSVTYKADTSLVWRGGV